MKVFDLACAWGHVFEGWFGSEQDFVDQCARGLLACPVCGDLSVQKKLSAPRLNLGGFQRESAQTEVQPPPPSVPQQEVADPKALTAALLEVARHVVANTTDVGDQFAHEARKMHYGDAPERSIRGKASVSEARALVEEGISVLPVLLPDVIKEPLQ